MDVLAQVQLRLPDEVLEPEVFLLPGARALVVVHAAPVALVKPPGTITMKIRHLLGH